jgi:type I restriction enzyme S subunit
MRPYVRAANVGWGGLLLDDVKAMNFTDSEMKVYRLNPGDLLLGEASGSPKEVGKPAVWNGEIEDCAFQNTLLRVRPRGADPGYLCHFFMHEAQSGNFASQSKGVGIHHLGRETLASWLVPYPPLDEQQRIARILDQADAVRAKRRATLDHLNILKKSIFLEMFAGPESEEWPLSTIEDVADPSKGSIRTGPFGSQLLHSEFVDDGVAVLGIDNAVENQFRWSKLRYISLTKYKRLARYTVHPGDVVITIMGTCGRCAIVPDDIPLAINTKHLCCITLDWTTCLPTFLHSYFLYHPTARLYLRQAAKGAVMDGLNMAIIRHLPLRLPPLPLQESYGRRIIAIESAEVALRKSRVALDDLFASVQSRAFRGEL